MNKRLVLVYPVLMPQFICVCVCLGGGRRRVVLAQVMCGGCGGCGGCWRVLEGMEGVENAWWGGATIHLGSRLTGDRPVLTEPSLINNINYSTRYVRHHNINYDTTVLRHRSLRREEGTTQLRLLPSDHHPVLNTVNNHSR